MATRRTYFNRIARNGLHPPGKTVPNLSATFRSGRKLAGTTSIPFDRMLDLMDAEVTRREQRERRRAETYAERGPSKKQLFAIAKAQAASGLIRKVKMPHYSIQDRDIEEIDA